MSRTPIAVAPARPTLVDYVFLLAGCSLSVYLLDLSPLPIKLSHSSLSAPLHELTVFLPTVLRLPEGILLMWPIFFITQFARRRAQGLTAVEWLWVISWVGVAVLAGLAVCERSGTLPDLFRPYAAMPRKLWYLIFVPSMAALAAFLGVVGVVRRSAVPWTHTLGLVLLLWPIAPLVGILSLGKFA
jgi:hypothetical protein